MGKRRERWAWPNYSINITVLTQRGGRGERQSESRPAFFTPALEELASHLVEISTIGFPARRNKRTGLAEDRGSRISNLTGRFWQLELRRERVVLFTPHMILPPPGKPSRRSQFRKRRNILFLILCFAGGRQFKCKSQRIQSQALALNTC